MTDQTRDKIEALIYKTFDAIDKTGANTQYYREIFANMSNTAFEKFIKRRLPFRVHVDAFKVEPTMNDAFDGFKVLNKPLMEKVKLPYLFKDKDGNPIETKECLTGYVNIKRMKQMVIKKNNTSINITKRDATGRLTSGDKGGVHSDKEFEANMALGLENTLIENARVKADAMKAKSEAYNIINTKGEVSFEEIDPDNTDSLAKNMLNVYLIGANLHSNLVDVDYYTPHTLQNKRRGISRGELE
jgi:hypothetical protein|nr:MAG TPA: hypothetical protein [Caudoviricetes sp.]